MRELHVLGRALWTPTFPSLGAYLTGEPDPDAQKPPVAFVGSRKKRGCSILTLAAAEVAQQAIDDAGINASEPALVFGSCHGEMEIAVAQMEMFLDGNGLLSPQRFKNSVHNTGAGMYSIAADNRGFATAIAGGHDTVALCLLEAFLLLHHDRYETAVVALADERLPAPLTHFSEHEALGVAIVLSRGPGPEGSLGTISVPSRGSERRFAADERFGQNPVAPLVDVALAVSGDATQEIPLSLAGGEPWTLRASPAPTSAAG